MTHEPHGARNDAEGNRRGVSVMLATTTLFTTMDALSPTVSLSIGTDSAVVISGPAPEIA